VQAQFRLSLSIGHALGRATNQSEETIMADFKLAISMVPQALWRENLRKHLTRGEWNGLRTKQFERIPKCEYCGSSPEGAARHAHEEWDYSMKAGTARLVGLRTICRMCHFVEHRGLVNVMVAKGRFTPDIFDQIERHFCAVNGCGPQDYHRHCKQAERRFSRLTQVESWNVDFGLYSDLIERRRESVKSPREGSSPKAETRHPDFRGISGAR
jgi:hypothetical protein